MRGSVQEKDDFVKPILKLEMKLSEKLNKKLESLVLHLKDLKVDKKRALGNFKEQLDACQSKIECIAETLQSGDKTILVDAFDQYEIEALER
mgnify:CR=1 FL=1